MAAGFCGGLRAFNTCRSPDMASIIIPGFKGGLDSTRLPETTGVQSMILAVDGHVTRGGEFEERAAFVPFATLPAGASKSLSHDQGALIVFGHAAAPGGLPSTVKYQRLQHPDGVTALNRVLSSTLFAGKVFCLAQFVDGSTYAFNDGVLVANLTELRARSTVQVTGGIPGGVVSSIKVGGVEILGAAVAWPGTSAALVTALAAQIAVFTSSPRYLAVALGNSLAIIAADEGAGPNGFAVVVTATDVVTTPLSPTMAGGVTTATAYQAGAFCTTGNQKIFALNGATLHFSGLDQPTKFFVADAAGAGFINMANQAVNSEALTGVGRYQGYYAVFGELTTQIWYMDPDPTLNKQIQVLNNTGTPSGRSIVQFGDNDIYYLDWSGVRSLRARYASNAAATTDVGVKIDTLILAALDGLTREQVSRIVAVIEPRDKRYWLVVHDEIFVLSSFPQTEIAAWTIYRPGFVVDDVTVFDRRVYLRSGDVIYVYGGSGAARVYDDTQAECWTAYLDGGNPTRKKAFNGFDAAARGTWAVRVAMGPNALTTSDKLATITGTTFDTGQLDGAGEATHFSLRFKAAGSGARPARLSAAIIHYGPDDDGDAA